MMCAVAFFQAVVTLFSNFLYFFKRVKLLSGITFFSSLLHVFIAFSVVHSYGINGVIWSSIITYIMSAILIVGFSIQSIRKGKNA
jgi:O-antigen/teichoic acid export membrane protein